MWVEELFKERVKEVCFNKEATSDIMFIDTEKSPMVHKYGKHPESHNTEVCFEQLYILELA